MKVLFAVSNDKMSEAIVKQYQKDFKEIITYKNVYYFNAILKELQRDKTYDRVVVSEDLEQYVNSDYEQKDNFIFGRLDSISDEASNAKGEDIPIILICEERRNKGDSIFVKLFGIGIYNAIIGNDRSINEVCRLVNRPRLKKDAKIYYKIDSEDVSYEKDDENDVSELEIQNILAHYKRIGNDEEKIVESFDSIASQYNNIQLKVICKFLPLSVKAVLEEKSTKYLEVNSFVSGITNDVRIPEKQQKLIKRGRPSKQQKDQEEPGTSEVMLGNSQATQMRAPVVVPSAMSSNKQKKIITGTKIEPVEQKMQSAQTTINRQPVTEPIQDTFNQFDNTDITEQPIQSIDNIEPIEMSQPIVEEQEQPVKRGRGRPKKVVTEEVVEQAPKRRRGRPRKDALPEENDSTLAEFNNTQGNQNSSVLPGLNNIQEEEEDSILPGFNNVQTEEEDSILPGFSNAQEEEEDSILPGFNNVQTEEDNSILPGFDNVQTEEDNSILPGFDNVQTEENNSILPGFDNMKTQENSVLQKTNNTQYEELDINRIMSPNQRLVSFVGTSKNGTSFLVNNIAEILSANGVDTAILDLTQNRSAYYIYTKNEENLRVKANECFTNLRNGIANGIEVHKDLTIYTSAYEIEEMENVEPIIQTLLKKHNIILMDCDFETPERYFKYAQEIYIVQSMDILTIQPLTVFLRKLSDKGLFDDTKARVVLNKYSRTKELNEDLLVGGISIYNDAAMTVRKELFNRRTVKRFVVPFDQEAYFNYLDGLVVCDVSLKNYSSKKSKMLLQSLKQLATSVYGNKNSGEKYAPPSISNNNPFSSNMNSTLNQMRRNY